MKRISFFLAAVTLFAVGPVRADDAATEERLNKLTGQIEDLKAGQEALRRQVESLVRELDAVRDQASKPTGNYAAVEDLNRLRDAIKEVDRKRIEDADKTRTELLRLGNLLAAGPGPGSAKRTGSASSRASERANNERGSSERGSSERGTRELASNDVKETSSKEGSKDGGKGQEEGFGYYQVQKGDTLSLIAQAYREKNIKLTPEQIVKANPGLVPEKLRVGQKLWIPAPQ